MREKHGASNSSEEAIYMASTRAVVSGTQVIDGEIVPSSKKKRQSKKWKKRISNVLIKVES